MDEHGASQASETPQPGVTPAAPPADAAQPTASPASPAGAETPPAAPDWASLLATADERMIDAVLKHPRIQDVFNGRVGKAAQRNAERQFAQWQAQWQAQQQAEQQRREIAQMTDDEFGRYVRENDRLRELQKAAQTETHRQWLDRLYRGIPEEVQAHFNQQIWSGRLDEDSLPSAILDWQKQQALDRELEQRLTQERQRFEVEKQRLLEEQHARARQSEPSPDFGEGTPVGAAGHSEMDWLAAYGRGEINDHEQARRLLSKFT